jgi:hypothetical protein
MKYQLTIEPNQGYAPDQTQMVTVADLRDLLANLDADDEICTYNYQNSYGAKFGGIRLELEPVESENE